MVANLGDTSTAVATSLGFFTRFSFFVVSLRFFASSATLSMHTCSAAAQRATTSWLSCLTMACRCSASGSSPRDAGGRST